MNSPTINRGAIKNLSDYQAKPMNQFTFFYERQRYDIFRNNPLRISSNTDSEG